MSPDVVGAGPVGLIAALLLADAAHMMPPVAGQGLNPGCATRRTWPGKSPTSSPAALDPAALATYEAERRGHAEATVALSGRLGWIATTTSPTLAAARDRRVRAAMADPEGRAWLEETRYRPRPDLAAGPCVPEAPPVDVGPGAGGHRPARATCPPCRVRPTTTPSEGSWTSTAACPARSALWAGRMVLVRPDRFIAATWPPGEGDRVADALAAHLGRSRPSTSLLATETLR